VKDREYIANDLFNGISRDKKMEHIDSNRLLKMYVDYREFEEKEYKKFLKDEISEKLKETEMFREYLNTFENSSEIKNYKGKPTFKNLSKLDQQKELEKRFVEFVKQIEQEKYLYFSLCLRSENEHLYEFQKTVIIKTGKELEEQKEYLGYTFEGDRGSEGIKVINYGGRLFDETNYDNLEKANSYVRNSINGIEFQRISKTQEKNVFIYALADLINFKQDKFEKIIKEDLNKSFKIESKWALLKLSELVDTIGGLWTGKTPPYANVNVIRNTNFTNSGKIDYSDIAVIDVEEKQYQNRKLQFGDIVIEKSGGSETQAVGRVVLFDKKEGDFSFSNFTARIRVTSEKINSNYLHIYLNYIYNSG